jgi:hypothetical protein
VTALAGTVGAVSTLPQGDAYVWVRMAFGRFAGAMTSLRSSSVSYRLGHTTAAS